MRVEGSAFERGVEGLAFSYQYDMGIAIILDIAEKTGILIAALGTLITNYE